MTYVGQENRQHTLGHIILRGLKTPIMPWSGGGPNEADLGGTLDATLTTGRTGRTPRAAP